MNISGIRPADGFYEKSLNKVSTENTSPIIENKAVDEELQSASVNERDVAASLTISEAGKTAAKNIAKAVINMENDTIIHRYQYLVQNKPAITEAPDKGELENFSL